MEVMEQHNRSKYISLAGAACDASGGANFRTVGSTCDKSRIPTSPTSLGLGKLDAHATITSLGLFSPLVGTAPPFVSVPPSTTVGFDSPQQ